MKKITLLAVAALAISFASCKKDRTCTCTETDATTGVQTIRKTTIYKAKKSEAREWCLGSETTTTYPNGTTSTGDKETCELK